MWFRFLAVALGANVQTLAWSPSSWVGQRVTRRQTINFMSPSEASSTLSSSQDATVAAIREAIPELAEKSDASWETSIGGAQTTLRAFDAPGRPNVAWMSSLVVDEKLCSLTLLNGPLTDVPHLVSRCSFHEDGTLSLFIDWRPRADGGYAMRKDDGTYPGPEELGREAFTYSGARATLEKKFYTPELEEFVASTRSKLGAPQSLEVSPVEASVRGPLAIDLRGVPISEGSISAVVEARAKAAQVWLGWQLDHDTHAHRPGAPVNTQYVFDTPMKQNMYTSLLETFTNDIFKGSSDDAAKLAAADSGPLDEAYVGGAS